MFIIKTCEKLFYKGLSRQGYKLRQPMYALNPKAEKTTGIKKLE